jgi:cytoskeletal protein CcmA (bactofilin family)
MSCLDELTLLTYADRELAPDAVAGAERHLAACTACRDRLAALFAEDVVLAAAVQRVPAGLVVPPPPALPGGRVTLLLGTAAALLAPALLGAGLDQSPGWLRSLWTRAAVSLAFDGLFALEDGGTIMFTNALTVALAAGAALLALLSFTARRGLRRARLPLALFALVAAAAAGPAQAFEVRKGDSVTVGPEETIDGRAVLAGQRVTLEGKVRGDVTAAGRYVVIRGTVTGDLYVAGEDVEILGPVEGNVHAVGGTLRLGAAVGRSVWVAGRQVTLTPEARVAEDLAGGAEQLRIEGRIGRDADLGGRDLYVAGSTGRHLTAWAETGEIGREARIGGDLRAKVPREGALRISEQATIGGARDVSIHPEMTARRDGDRAGWNLFRGIFGLLAALLLAFLAYRFAPAAIPASPRDASEAGRWLGLGFVLLVTVPAACLFVALTLFGLPLAVMTFGLYLAACYLASIAAAILLGRRLLRPGEAAGRFLLATGLGWIVLFAVGLVPVLGAGVRFLALLVGLGALFTTARGAMRGRSAPAIAGPGAPPVP